MDIKLLMGIKNCHRVRMDHISKDLTTTDPIPDEDGKVSLLWRRAKLSRIDGQL